MAVQLPPSWPSKCLITNSGSGQQSGLRKRTIESVPASGLTDPDVSVVRESILAGSQPWTEQYGGCRVRGLRIRLPSHFLDLGDREDDENLLSRGKFKVEERAERPLLQNLCRARMKGKTNFRMGVIDGGAWNDREEERCVPFLLHLPPVT